VKCYGLLARPFWASAVLQQPAIVTVGTVVPPRLALLSP
jgi:hypothetical protein